ncbi:MAG TPA: NRDE family protein [Pyrinomonadaceae bacterium]|jgi:uncharacterized protein with NRDE domain
MCIILFAYKTHPRYRLILAANRDEYYARPTERAAFWKVDGEILAGRDLERGGTWLGVTKGGRFAAVTNFRDPSALKKDAPSRGHLVSDFLRGHDAPSNYLSKIAAISASYNGFNLIAGDARQLCYHSNREAGVRELQPGVYGLSNHLLDTPWPKVEKGKRALSEIVREGAEVSRAELLQVLADDARADDSSLPQTGISLEYERALSPVFIQTPVYGTRSSTLLLIDSEESITFVERAFEHEGQASDVSFQFQSRKSDAA